MLSLPPRMLFPESTLSPSPAPTTPQGWLYFLLSHLLTFQSTVSHFPPHYYIVGH